MSATVTSISSGPRTPRGKSASALNALSHGLTARSPVLPSESPAQFEAFRAAILDRFSPQAPEDIAAILDYVDVTWRLRRIAILEAEMIALEIQRMQDDPAIARLLPTLTPNASEALAVERLFASRALVNLHRMEDRLTRRLKINQPLFDFLAERANEREYLRRQAEAQAANQTTSKLALVKNELPIGVPVTNDDAGRNDLCPCGSGLKWKRCCIAKSPLPEAA